MLWNSCLVQLPQHLFLASRSFSKLGRTARMSAIPAGLRNRPQPVTATRKPQTANRKPQTANRKPQTANRKPQTANRKPQTVTVTVT
ncbi:hypothetical protein C2I18_14815 [Paenibacillus sp. PK3_47]|nr:hypothetical protein C2I18_14815 [Paenibacillus sp. PK3_47]